MDRFETYVRMLEAAGTPLRPGARLLDFGCGAGATVKAAVQAGFDAYGCDIDFGSEWVDQAVLAEMRAQDRVRTIETPYRLPFPDGMFDAVVSDQVFEHVRNYEVALAELHRVMKPGAAFLHIFPSRYMVREPHVHIPFAGVFHPRWYLALWARLGVRNEYQQQMNVAEAVQANVDYLREGVNYLPPSELRRQFGRGFRFRFVEREFMRLSPRARKFLLPALYRTFWQRCVHGVKV